MWRHDADSWQSDGLCKSVGLCKQAGGEKELKLKELDLKKLGLINPYFGTTWKCAALLDCAPPTIHNNNSSDTVRIKR